MDGNPLLNILESARDLLARRLVEEYPAITEPDINYTVHTTLLQVLFLRCGQETGFALPGTLSLLEESDGIGKRMARACSDAGLSPEIFFERGPDGSHPVPAVPDDVLRELIRRASSTGFPAPLSVIQPEELAVVLDHLLGTRLKVGEGYRLEKIGKSAVHYTGTVDTPPQTVVDAMVNATLHDLIRLSPAADNKGVRILDPACGAGTFLLAAFRFLARKAAGHDRDLQDATDALRGILCRSVFGTDIDPESVSAARFCLLLAFIGESRGVGPGVPVTGEIREVSGCLRQTVRCGNTLVAPDYFSGRQEHPFNAGERRKVNPFSWEDNFPGILATGGFDAVIGAPPPYRPFAIPAREDYFQTHYDTYAQGAGLYTFFIERALSLLRADGAGTFLIPGTFLRSNHARPLRRYLLSRQILAITATGRTRLLQEGRVPFYILRIRNTTPDHPFVVSAIESRGGPESNTPAGRTSFSIDQKTLDDGGWKLEDTRVAALLGKLRVAGTPLDRYVMGQILHGTVSVQDNPFVTDTGTRDRLTKRDGRCRRFFIPLLNATGIRRYVPERPEQFVIAAPALRDLTRCRPLLDYLGPALKEPAYGPEPAGPEGRAGRLSPVLDPLSDPVQNIPKIIFSPCQQEIAFTYDRRGSYAITGSLLAIERDDPYLAAILNSTLARFLIPAICPLTDRGYDLSPANLGKFPVVTPDFDRLPDKTLHDKIVELVTQILSLQEYLQTARTEQERRLVQQEIDATDVKIDALVYELYGLDQDEIGRIEETRVR